MDCLGNLHNLYNPRVLRVPDRAYPYRLWLFGWAAADDNPGFPGSDAVFHARSRDLKTWEAWAGDKGWDRTMDPAQWVPVLTADAKPYDSVHNGDPSVVFRDGVYYMAFSSVGFDRVQTATGQHTYLMNCIMGATSPDGIHWTKSARPILLWSREPTNRWELKNGQVGSPPPDYYGSYHRPALLWDEGRWKLWFDYYHPGTFLCMGYAENTGDFLKSEDWRVLRADQNPCLKDWPNPAVIRIGRTFWSFADAPNFPAALGGDGRQLTQAQSQNGLDWVVQGHIRPDGMASSHVPEPFLLQEGGATWLYLFYAWKPAPRPGEAWDFRYKKIRYIRRRVD